MSKVGEVGLRRAMKETILEIKHSFTKEVTKQNFRILGQYLFLLGPIIFGFLLICGSFAYHIPFEYTWVDNLLPIGFAIIGGGLFVWFPFWERVMKKMKQK